MIRKHFRLKKIALGLAFAAVVVPTAQAKVILPGNPAPAWEPTAIKLAGAALVNAPASQALASGISVQAPVAKLGAAALVNAPASQTLASGISVKSTESRPGITAAGTAIANAKHSAYPVQAAQTQAAGSGSFNWGDAGIGASISLGVALMLLMAVLLGRRYRSRPTGLAST